MTLLNDRQIKQLQGIITPFRDSLIRENDLGQKAISYGLSSFGYDLTLAPDDFRIFRHRPGKIVNPKDFDETFLEKAELQHSYKFGQYFIIPGNSYALGVTRERLKIPTNCSALFIGKSTYARAGIIVNCTPAEPGWEGYLTIEISNSSPSDAMVYANEGILQMLIHQGETCEVSYADRAGKYQNQQAEITVARI